MRARRKLGRKPGPRSELGAGFHRGHGSQRQGASRSVVKAVAPGPIKRMLDLGGGSGAYSIAFAKAIAGLKSEILDLAEVIPLLQEYIQKAGLADRISTRAGDMLHAPLGEAYDLILISAICHMFSPEENRSLLQRAYTALAPKGQVVVQDFILEPGKTAPRFAALFSLNMLVGTQAEQLQRAGICGVVAQCRFCRCSAGSIAGTGQSDDCEEIVSEVSGQTIYRKACFKTRSVLRKDRNAILSVAKERTLRMAPRSNPITNWPD